MAKQSLVPLPADERAALLAFTKQGTVSARPLTRAHLVLQADAQATNPVPWLQGSPCGTTIPPAEARRLLQKLDFRYTPKHGSWLNMAENEFAVLSTQCLDRRSPDQALVRRRIRAWEAGRNADHATIHWRFTTAKARRKLKRLYPA